MSEREKHSKAGSAQNQSARPGGAENDNAKQAKAPAASGESGAPDAADATAPAAAVGEQGVAVDVATQPSEEQRLREQLLRLSADFANFKKRIEREGALVVAESRERMLTQLLPVLDHFELGLNSARLHNINGQVLKGFQMVYEQLLAILTQEGLRRVEVHAGQQFDSSVHECVSQVPSEEYPENTIIAEPRAGYCLGRKVLRPAQVVLSSGPAGGTAKAPSETAAGDQKTGNDCAGGSPPASSGSPGA